MKLGQADVLGGDSSLISHGAFSILNIVKMRLSTLGWTLVFDRGGEEAKCFESLIPSPDATFTAIDSATGECRAIALHFNVSEGDIRYVCSMQLSNGDHAQEFGRLKRGAEKLAVLTTHDEWLRPRHGAISHQFSEA